MKMRITVEGKSYDVEVEVLDERNGAAPRQQAPTGAAASIPPKPASAAPPPRPAASSGPAGAGAVHSPIAGSVVSVKVKVGDDVAVNDPLLVLEAMKMESTVASPASGTVREVCIKQGDAVQAGQVLVRIGS